MFSANDGPANLRQGGSGGKAAVHRPRDLPGGNACQLSP